MSYTATRKSFGSATWIRLSAMRGRLLLGRRGESGEQIPKLLCLVGPHHGNQALSQWHRGLVSGVEKVQALRGDLDRAYPPIPWNGLAHGQPFALQVVYDPHDPRLVRARCLDQVPLLGGPAVDQDEQHGEMSQLDAERPKRLRHHRGCAPVRPAQQQPERERRGIPRAVGRARGDWSPRSFGDHQATLLEASTSSSRNVTVSSSGALPVRT